MESRKAILYGGGQQDEAAKATIPPIPAVEVMVEYSKWYTKGFGTIQPEWYVFPFGKLRRATQPPDCHSEDVVEQRSKESQCPGAVAR